MQVESHNWSRPRPPTFRTALLAARSTAEDVCHMHGYSILDSVLCRYKTYKYAVASHFSNSYLRVYTRLNHHEIDHVYSRVCNAVRSFHHGMSPIYSE